MTQEEINKLREDTRALFKEKFGNIVFEEIPHRYTIDGVEYTPVSTIISQYENEFDLEERSRAFAIKNNLTQDEVKKKWRWTNVCATVMGTRAHEFGESYTNMLCGKPELICPQNKPQYLAEENWMVPTFPQEFAIKQFYDDLNGRLHPVGAEFKLSTKYIDGAKPICGTADLLFYYDAPDPSKSGFVIGDWKGLDVNTPIFTTDGWKTMGTVQVGDVVYDKDGFQCKVLHTSEVHHRKCYKLTFDNQEEIISDNEHRWLITLKRKKKGKKKVVMTSEELYEYLKGVDTSIPSRKIPKIYNPTAIRNDYIKLPINPYVFGVWLGNKNKSAGEITNVDECIWEEIKFKGYVVEGDNTQTRTVVGLTDKLASINVLNNKHIPDIYLKASSSDRLELLRGLMDINGEYDKTRLCFTMCTIQEWKAEAISVLLSSLGIKSTCDRRNDGEFHITFACYFNPFLHKYKKVSKHQPDDYNFRRIIKIEEVDSVPTRCIEVDSNSHTFLCGKNFLVTHNTNRELTKEFVRNTNMMMLPPFTNYYDEALSHYYVQFNLYQRMMESVGLNIIARRLIHIKRDGTYEVYQVPKIDDNIIDQVIMT